MKTRHSKKQNSGSTMNLNSCAATRTGRKGRKSDQKLQCKEEKVTTTTKPSSSLLTNDEKVTKETENITNKKGQVDIQRGKRKTCNVEESIPYAKKIKTETLRRDNKKSKGNILFLYSGKENLKQMPLHELNELLVSAIENNKPSVAMDILDIQVENLDNVYKSHTIGSDEALCKAVEKGFYYLCQKMIICGSEAEFYEFPIRNILHIASEKGQIDTFKLLLKKYAKHIDYQDDQGNTPLHCCQAGPNAGPITLSLLSAGAKVDVCNFAGETPLLKAVQNRNISAINELHRKGSDPTIQDKNNQSPTSVAEVYGIGKIFDILQEHDTPSRRSTIMILVRKQEYDVELLRHLLLLGEDINTLNYQGSTALTMLLNAVVERSYSSKYHCESETKEDKGYDYTDFRFDQSGFSLPFSDEEKHFLALLLNAGSDIYHTENKDYPSWVSDQSAFIIAVKAKDKKLLHTLIHRSQDHKNVYYARALELMTKAGDKEMVDFLVFHMNRLKLELTEGEATSMVKRTLFKAIESRQTDSDMLISLLKVMNNFDFSQVVLKAAENANEHFFMKLVSSYPDEFQKRVGGLDGTVWLCSACRGDSISIIEYLTNQGASPMKLNVMGDIDVEEEPMRYVKSAKVLNILLKNGVKDHLLSPRKSPVRGGKSGVLLGDLGFSQSFEFKAFGKKKKEEEFNDIEMFNTMVKWNGQLSSHVVELALNLPSSKEELKQLVLTQLLNKNIVESSFDGSALYVAVSKGETGFAKALIDGTKDGMIKDSLPNLGAELGFKAARCSNNIEMLQLIFESNLIPCCNTLLHQILLYESTHEACIHGIGSVIDLLLHMGADINSLSSEGKPAICQAAASGHGHIVSILLGSGADVNVVWNGKTPLSLILEYENVEAFEVEDILMEGGRISAEETLFAVHKSIVKGDFETTRTLIEIGGFNPVVMNRSSVFCKPILLVNISNILSPLCMALICCEFAIADHFINIGYLTESDIKLLPTHPELKMLLEYASKTIRDLVFQKLESLSSIVPSMFKLAFHKLSNIVGSQPLREKKVQELEIPFSLQKALMFRDRGFGWPKPEDTGGAREDINEFRQRVRGLFEDDESEDGDGSENGSDHLSDYDTDAYNDEFENDFHND